VCCRLMEAYLVREQPLHIWSVTSEPRRHDWPLSEAGCHHWTEWTNLRIESELSPLTPAGTKLMVDVGGYKESRGGSL
jgi:hypothetical protein